MFSWQVGQPLQAATFYWDADASGTGNTTSGTNIGGTGTWNTSLSNWWDGASGTDTTWGNGATDIAIFGGTAGTVTTGNAMNVGTLTFNSSGYVITGSNTNTLTLGTGGVTFGTGVTGATINAVLAGSSGLTFNGGTSNGTLFLNGANANTYSGTTSISSGILQIGVTNALGLSGAGNDTLVNSGGALRISVTGTIATEPLSLAGTGVSSGGALVVDPGLTSTWSGAVTIASAATINTGINSIFSPTGGLTVTGNLTKAGVGKMTLAAAGATGTGTLTINAGTFSITSSGATTFWNGGNIGVSAGGTLQTTGSGTDSFGVTNSAAITVSSGGVLDWQQTGAETLTSISLTGSGLGGTGALTTNAATAGGAITATISLAGNTTIGALSGGSVKLLSAITGNGNTLTKVGLGSLISTDSTTSTKPFGDGNIVLQEGTMSIIPGAAGVVAFTGVNAAANSTFTYSGGGTFGLTRNSSTSSTSYTIGNAGATANSVLVRSGKGTLVIAPSAGTGTTTFGGSAAGFENFVITNQTTASNKNGAASGTGIYDASVVGIALNAGTFLTYGGGAGGTAGGFGTAAYTTAATGTPATNSIQDLTTATGAATFTGGNPYAIRVNPTATLTISGTTTVNGVTAGAGSSGLGGIILNAGTTVTTNDALITGGILDFSASEGVIFVATTSAGVGKIASQINGSAGITKFGPGTLVLTSTSNAFTGGVNINQGTLSVAADTNLGAAANGITFNGAAGLSLSASAVTYARGITLNNNANATITLITGATNTFTGKVTGAGGLTVTGITTASTLNLTATNNDFTGSIRVTNGTAAVGGTLNVNSLADSSSAGTGNITLGNTTAATTFVYGAGAIAALTLNNRQIELAGTTGGAVLDSSSAIAGNTITINTDLLITGAGAKTLTLQGANSGTFAGMISNDLTNQLIGITKSGTGNWSLTNTNNTFTGAITLAGGTTNAGVLSIASAGGANAITFSGTTGAATLRYTGAGQTFSGAVSLNSVTTGTSTLDATGTGAWVLSNTAAIAAGAGIKTLVLTGTNASSNTLAAVLADNSGTNKTSLSKTGSGTWVLTNNNSYTGATTVTAGTLTLDATAVGTPASGILAATSTLTLAGGTLNVLPHATLATTQTFATTALTGSTYSNLSATGSGGGLTVLTGAITRGAAAGLNVNLTSSPTVTLTSATAPNGVVVDANGNAFMSVNGTDWANLSTQNVTAATYTADTYTAGTNTNVTTFTGNPSSFTTNTLRLNAGGGGTLTLAGTNIVSSGGVLIGSGSGAVAIGAGGTLTGTASRELNIFQNSASTTTINAVIANNNAAGASTSAAVALNKYGTGLLVLGGSNTFTGGLNVASGTVRMGNAGALNSSMLNAVTLGGTGTLQLFNNSVTVSGLSNPAAIAGAIVENGGTTTNAVLTVRNAGANTFAGVLRDGSTSTLGLTQVGTTSSGVLTLTGVNTYTGATVIGGVGVVSGGGIALSGSGQITATSGITFSGGTLTITNVNGTEGLINRVNSAAITSNGGSIVVTNTAGAANFYSQSLGTVALTRGQLSVVSSNATTSPATELLTLGGLTQSGSSTIAFGMGGFVSGTPSAQNQINITGQATTTNTIIGPWATVGTTAAAQTDYATYNYTGGTMNASTGATTGGASNALGVNGANITAVTAFPTVTTAFSNTANMNLANGTNTTTLTADTSLNTLRYTGGAASVATSTFKLGTFGVLQAGTGLLTISGTGALTLPTTSAGNVYLTTGTAQGITVSAPINDNTGALTLVVGGQNSVTLSSTTSNYSGGTVINGGTLSVAADTNLGATSGGITFNGGGNLSISASAITIGATRTVTINNGAIATVTLITGATDTIAGKVTGTGGLTATGITTASTLNLTATNNDFTGPIRVTNGTAAIGGTLNVNSLADSLSAGTGNVTLGNSTLATTFVYGSGAIAALTLNNRQIELAGTTGGAVLDSSSAIAGNTVTINTELLITGTGNKTVTLQGANSGTFGGRIGDGTGSVIGITKAGVGTWNLSGANNTFTGAIASSGTTTSAGALSYASAGGTNAINVTQTTSTFTLRYTGAGQTMSGQISLAAMTTGTFTLDGSGAGAVNYSNTGTLGVAASGNKNLILRGTNTGANSLAGLYVNNTGGTATLTKLDAGTWVLTNNNTYTGATTVNAGKLTLDASGVATPANGVIASGSALTLGGGTLNVLGNSLATTQAFNGTTLTAGTYSSLTATAGAGGLTINTGAFSRGASSVLNISPGTATVNLSSGVVAAGNVIASATSGAAYITLNGSDWANLSGTNVVATFYTTSLAGTTAPGTTANVDFQASNSTAWNTQTVNTLRFNTAGASTLNITSGQTLTVAAGGILIGSTSGTVNIGGAGLGILTGSSSTSATVISELNIIQNSASTLTLAASIRNNLAGQSYASGTPGGTATALSIFGTGTVQLNNTSNTYSGGTNVSGTATLKLGANSVIPGFLSNANSVQSTVTISGGATLDLNGTTQTINALAGTGFVNNSAAGASTLIFGNANAATTFSGVFQNSGGGAVNLVKTGTGTVTLNNQSTFSSGSLVIIQGTLGLNFTTAPQQIVSNLLPANITLTLGSGILTVTGSTQVNGQTFAGTTLSGGATVTTAGTTPAVTVNLGAITRGAGSTLAVNFGTSPTGITTTTTANTGTTILGGWAVVGATVPTGWAVSAGNGTTAGAITALAAGGYTNDTWAAGNNTDVVTAATAPTSGSTTNSLRFNTSLTTPTVTLAGTNTITTGGILVTGAVGSNNVSITGGSLQTSDGGELYIFNYNTNTNKTITIASNIIANAGSAATEGVTIMGTTGVVSLTGTNTYAGATTVNGGVLTLAAAGNLGSTSKLVLNGGTVTTSASVTFVKPLEFGLAGATFNGAGTSATFTLNPTAVTYAGSGPRTITFTTGTTDRQHDFSPSGGLLQDNGGPTSIVMAGSGDTALWRISGANTYTGSTTITRGVLRLNNTSAIGGGLLSTATIGNVIFAGGANRAILETNATAGTITRSVGYEAGQIHWESNGGFSNSTAATQVVNLGAGAALTWGVGGFVPTASRLQFGQAAGNSFFNAGTIDFQNAIALGASGTRTIEAATGQGTTTDRRTAILEGILSGTITSTGAQLVKEGVGTIELTGSNSGGSGTIAVNTGTLYFGSTSAILGTGANITLSTTAGTNAAIGVAGDTNPMSTFSGRITNASTSTAAFLLGADSSAALDFTSYPNMRLSALAFQNASTTPAPLNGRAVTYTGSITPASSTYRFGGNISIQNANAAAATLVLGRQNMLTGTNALDLTFGATTITAANNYSGGTIVNGNAISVVVVGIGSNAAFGAGTISLQGTRLWNFGNVNGDHSVSNNISIAATATAASWIPGGDNNTNEDSILNNTNQGTLSYLGTVDLGGVGRTFTGRLHGVSFLGDITNNNTGGLTLANTVGGYFSFLTAANGGTNKTYTGTTTLGDNVVLVIDSDSSLGASGNITLGGSTIQVQPGTSSVTIAATRSFVNTAAKNPVFDTPTGSTLTFNGTFGGSTTGTPTKTGLGTVSLGGDATGAVSTGALLINAGKLIFDAATRGSAVWTSGGPLTLGSASGTYGNGGTLEISGTFAQTLGAVTVNPRANNINLTGAMALTLGAITRTTGSTLNFSVPTGSATTTSTAAAGLINGATTWNGNDFAGLSGAGPAFAIGAATYTTLTGTSSVPTITTNATANYNITSATTNNITLAAAGTLAAPNNANTIRYSDSTARTIDVRSGGSAGFLRLGTGGAAAGGVTNAGGVLVASGAGALTIGVSVANGGSLMAGGTTTNTLGDLVFINNSTSDITVNSAIVNNNGTTGTTPVSYNGMSTGKLILAGNNTFTGALIINSGTLEVATVNAVAAAGPLGQGTAAVGSILLNGGTFRANLGANGATDKGFTVNAQSTIEVVANILTLNTTLNGVATAAAHQGTQNAGILKKTGAGTLELKDLGTNANNANLSIEVVAGTLLLNKTTNSTISAVDLAGGAALIIDSAASGAAPTVKISGTAGNQISDTSSVVVNGGSVNGVLDLNGLSETIDGLAGTGTVTNSVSATSTLTVGGNNSSGISAYTLAAAAAGVNATGLNSFGGVIQDGGAGKVMALTKTGSGTQILTGNSTYSGTTTISAGTLQLGIDNALPSGAGKSNVLIQGNNVGTNVGAATTNGSDKVLAPGTFDLGGYNQAINGLDSTTGGVVTNNPTLSYNGSAWTVAAGRQGTKTLTIGNSIPTNGSFNGVIQDGYSLQPGVTASAFVGVINLVKTGTNTQTLSGANTYGGTTAVQGGTLTATGGTDRLPTTTTVTLGSGATSGVLQLGDGTGAVSQTIAGLATSGSGSTNAVVGGNSSTNSTLVLNQTGTATYSGALGGAGANQNKLNLTVQGGGTLTLNNASNTLAGTTTVQGGSTLILASGLANSAIAVGSTGAGTLISNQTLSQLVTVNNGGVLAPGATQASDVATLTLAGGLTLNTGGTLALQIGSTSTLTTPLVNDMITITGGVFTITGGQISLSELTPAASVGALLSSGVGVGNYNLINYSGASNAAAFAAGTQFSTLSLASSVIGTNNYFVTLVNDTVNKIIQLNVDNARFWSGATDGQWNTTVANWSPLNPTLFLNTDKVIFQDTYPIVGSNANVVNSNINLTTTVTPVAVTFNNTTVNYTLGGIGSIGGSTGLNKSGTGSLIITNANSFTGNTVISGGYVEIRNAAALGTTAGIISVGNGAALRASGGITVGAKAISLTGSGFSGAGGALRNVSGNNSFAGTITLTGDARINSDAGLLTLSGAIANGTNNLTFGGTGNITASGIIGSGSGTLTVDGTGIVTLSNAANTYTGQTFIKNGTLSVSTIGSVTVAGGLGTAPDAATGTIAIGDSTTTGTLQWTGSANESTDRVINLAGATGGAVLDASGTSGSVLTIASPLTYTGLGNKTLTLTGTGGTAGTPNVLSNAIGNPSGFSTSLLKTGTGVWQINGANSYSGTTTVNGGTLQLGVGATLITTLSTDLTIANGSGSATLDLNGQSQTFNGINFGGASATSSAQGTVAIGAAGTLTLGGDVTYSATGNSFGASITGSGTSTLDLNGVPRTFTVGSSTGSGGADLTISAVIADAATGGSLVKAGAGTLVLTGANTYAGATTVNAGTLSATPGAIATSGPISISGGNFNLYADNAIATATLATNANLSVSSGGLGFQLSGTTNDRINLTGTGALTASGGIINARALATLTPGSFTLLDNTNAGTTPIAGFTLGVLTGGYTYALDNSTGGLLKLTVGAAATGPYYWNGSLGSGGNGSWASLGSGVTSTNWRLNSAGTTEAGATPGGVDVIFATDTAANVTTTLDQPYSITGLQFLNNASGTGNVTIAAGSGDGSLTIGANGIFVNSAATSTNTTISSSVILGSAQTWDVGTSRTLTVSGVVSGNGRLLTKSSAGTLVLSGVNTYNGGTTITGGGIVQINSAASLGASTGVATLNNGTVELTGSSNSVSSTRNFLLGTSGGTITVDATNTYTLNGVLSNLTTLGTLTANGAGILQLYGTNTYDGGTTISGGGIVQINSAASLGASTGVATLNNGTVELTGSSNSVSSTRNFSLGSSGGTITVDATNTYTLNGVLSNLSTLGTLTANGAGILQLYGTNTYDGGTTITGGGTVQINTEASLGASTGAVTLNNGTVELTGSSNSVSSARSFSLGSTGGTIMVDPTNTYTLNGVLSNLTTLGTLTVNGAGTLQLFGANTYDGGTTITGTGTVQINSATSLGAESGNATINNAILQATANITTTRNFLLGSYGSTFSVDATKTLAVSGSIADGVQAGTLNKTGSGTLNLTKAPGNSYTGGTFVTGGTLRANNSSGSATGTGAVAVTGSGTTLGGAGFISGAVSIGSGAILAPGNSAGTLTVGSLTLATGSLLSYELAGTSSSDKTIVAGANGLTVNGGQFTLTGLAGLTNGTYNLITYTGTLGGSFSNLSLASPIVLDPSNNAYFVRLVNNTGSIDLVSTNSMVWNGNIGGTTWDNGTTANTNWKSGTTTNLNFYNTMVATFDDTASNFTVNVDSAGVAPSSITVNAANNYTFQGTGAITGATGITKGGAGTLTIKNANSFSGNIALNAGAIEMQDPSALGTTGTITITAGASLRLNPTTGSISLGTRITSIGGGSAIDNVSGNNSATLPGAITAATSFVSDAGTLTLAGNVTSSSLALSLLGNGNITMTGTSISIANSNFTVNTGGTVTVANNITVGTSVVVINGTGSTTLNGTVASTSTGSGIQVSNSGTNIFGSTASVTGAAGSISINQSAGGSTSFNGAVTTNTGGLTIAGAGATTFGSTVSATTGLLTISSNGNTAFNGAITGSGALTKSGSGTLTLAGNNNYTGSVTINDGKVILANGLAVDNAAAVVLANVATASLQLNNSETIGSLAGGGTTGGNVNLQGNTLTTGANNTTTSYGGIISGTLGALIKDGTGTMTLSGVNTFTGDVTLLSGSTNTLVVASDANLGAGSAIHINQNATLSTTATFATSKNIEFIGASPSINAASATTLTLNGVVNGASTTPNFGGAGKIILNNSANSFATNSVLLINGGGTLGLGNAAALTGAMLKYNGGVGLDNTSGSSMTLTGQTGLQLTSGFTFIGTNSLDMSGAGTSFVQTAGSTRTITVSANTLTIAGILTTGTDAVGTARVDGALTKAGVGTLTLASLSDYTGATAVNAGTLEVLADGALGTTAAGTTVVSGAALKLTSVSYTTAEALSLSGTGVSNGGSLVGSGTSSYAGAITLAADSRINSTSGTLTLDVASGPAISGAFALTFGGSGNITVADAITTGANGITKDGSGTLTLVASNTYTGKTIVNVGTLSISSEGNLGNNPGSSTADQLTLNGGTLQTTANLTISNSNRGVTMGASGGTFETATSITATVNSVITGSGSLSKTGAGILVLGAANTYTGKTIISGGTLSISNENNLGANPGSSTADQLTLNGGTLRTTATLTIDDSNRGITVGASGGTFETAGSTTATINSVIIGGPVTKTDTGSLVFTAANTYTAKTSIQEGALSVGTINSVSGGAASSNLGAPTTAANGTVAMGAGTTTGTLIYTGSGETTDRVVDLAGTTGGGTIDQSGTGLLKITSDLTASGAGAKVLTLQGSTAGTGEISGAIVDNSSTNTTGVVKNGTGTWVLSGANTYTGKTIINAGRLSISSEANLGANPGAGTADQLTLNGGTLVTTATLTIDDSNRGITVGASGGTFETAASTTATVNSVIIGGGSVTKTGAGTLVFTAANTYTGKTSIQNDALSVGTINSVSGGAGSSNLGAPTTVGNGTIGLGGGTTTGALIYTGSGETTDRVVDLAGTTGGGTIDQSGTGLLKITSDLTASGAGAKVLTLQGSTAGTGEISGAIVDNSSTNTTGVVKTGTGTWVLSGANTYTGKTSIQNGALSVSSINSVAGGTASSSLGAPVTTANGTIDMGATTNTGTLVYTGAGSGETTDRVINLAGTTGGGTLDQSGTNALKFTSNLTATGAGSKVLTLQGSTAGTGEISGAIVDNSSTNTTGVVKNGTGTWVLSGTNTYTGATTVNGGTLQVGVSGTGGIGNSAVTVNSTATLSGSGGIAGSTIIGSGAVLAPGDGNSVTSNATLTFSAATTSLTVADTGSIHLGLTTADSTDSGFAVWFQANPGGTAAQYVATLQPGNTGTIADTNWNSIHSGSHDFISAAGTIVLGSSNTSNALVAVSLNNLSGVSYGSIFNIMDWSALGGPLSSMGTFNVANNLQLQDLSTFSAGLAWDTSLFDSFGILVVVPEPNRVLLLMFGLLGLLARRRRRQVVG